MILITGGAKVRSENLGAALALCVEHSIRSRAESGCLAHNCHVDAEDPNRIVFLEYWADMAAVQTHFAVPESGEFVRKLSAMAAGRPEIQLYEANALASPFE